MWGSWIGLFLNILCLIAQFYIAVWPIGGEPSAQGFFESYLAAPIILALFLSWKIWKRTKYVRIMDIDLQSGRRDLNLRELREQEAIERANWGRMKRYEFLCCMLGLMTGFTFGCADFEIQSPIRCLCVSMLCRTYATRVCKLMREFSVFI